MGDVTSNAGPDRHRGFAFSKKLSTRVDLTPMVDLGFLLITFFIFTTKMSEPKAMNLYMPTDKGDSSTIGESTSLTILTSAGNKIFYYHGSLKLALEKGLVGVTNYSLRDGIGDVIRAKQIALDKREPGSRRDLMLLIKPSDESKYEHVINILDEVLINVVPHYAIMDVSDEEQRAMDARIVNWPSRKKLLDEKIFLITRTKIDPSATLDKLGLNPMSLEEKLKRLKLSEHV